MPELINLRLDRPSLPDAAPHHARRSRLRLHLLPRRQRPLSCWRVEV